MCRFEPPKSFITVFLVIRAEQVTFLIYVFKYEEHTCLSVRLAGGDHKDCVRARRL